MVSPDLSRKLAKLFPMLTALGMTVSQRFELADKLESIDNLEQLEPNFLEKIKLAEELVKSGKSEFDVMKIYSGQRQNSFQLDEVADFIKLNYKCKDEEKVGTGIKHNERYLEEVTIFLKQNSNCPDNEKVGTGPGSCSGNKDKVTDHKDIAMFARPKLGKSEGGLDFYARGAGEIWVPGDVEEIVQKENSAYLEEVASFIGSKK